MANKIYLIGENGRIEEANATATIKPGMLLTLGANGVAPHATAGGVAERLYALPDVLQGKTIDDDYASGDLVRMVVAMPGDVIQAWLKSGNTVSPGDFLSSAGDGKLKPVGDGETPVAVALEAVDASSADARIVVRVL